MLSLKNLIKFKVYNLTSKWKVLLCWVENFNVVKLNGKKMLVWLYVALSVPKP